MTPVPLHLGSLHPIEQALTLVLAFGPFLVLGLVIVLRRRSDERAAAADVLPVEATVESPDETDAERGRPQRDR